MHAWYYKVCLHGVLKPLSNNYNLEDKIFPELILFFLFFLFYLRKHGKEENERRTCNQATGTHIPTSIEGNKAIFYLNNQIKKSI
jgi:hypothetical protein